MKIKKIKPNGLVEEIRKLGKKRLVALSVLEGRMKFAVLYQFGNEELISLEVKVPKKKPVLNSIIRLFPSANFYECEAHDLFGIEFKGNPHLHDKLFLADDWKEKPPLRKK